MKTFQEFLAEAKSKAPEVGGFKTYSLSDIPEPKETKPGSKARAKQIEKLVTKQSGAKAIKKALKKQGLPFYG